MSLINTVSSYKEPSHRQQGHRPWKCLFLRRCAAWKLQSNFISLTTTAFVWLTKQVQQMRIHTANISRQCSHWACVGYAYRVHYNYDPPFVWNETGVHSWTKVYLLFQESSCKNIEARVHYMLYEGIILQKRFVKKSNWNFRNLEKNTVELGYNVIEGT
jgi:hypothetical protein